jgi:hypothetical protein
MPDESRIFDVSRPSRVNPSPTSKPVIVGHHPMSDPMVKNDGGLGTENHERTKIAVTGAGQPTEHQPAAGPSFLSHPADPGSPAVFSDPPEENEPSDIVPRANHPESVAYGPFTEAEPEAPAPEPDVKLPETPDREPHIEGLHLEPAKRRRGVLKPALLGILVLVIGAYLLIDSGVVNAGFKLPFHLFKQKTPPVAAPAPVKQAPVVAAVPAGFKKYKLAETNLTFAAPVAWGDPASTTDPGFSKRSAGAQPAGTYAYLVNFSANKDIQVAVTSGKLLPSARTSLYYDYLQWCIGTADGLIYESILNFTTANKVDTPTTVTCNQGPVAGASQLDTTTIVQKQAKDNTNKVMGDIYTKNLNDPALVVLRIKDGTMTNSTEIKKLLGTVKITAAQSTSSSAP